MSPSVPAPLRAAVAATSARDGRDARWEAHRTKRRTQLVDAALKAIRQHGAGVGMDEVAATAGTSKTVLYRHLGDKAGLYRAVVAAVDARILGQIAAAESTVGGEGGGHPGGHGTVERIAAMVRAYLAMVERDPEIYRFVMTRPLDTTQGGSTDPVHQITDRVAGRLTEVLREHLNTVDDPDAEDRATVWGSGIVGMVQSAAELWLSGSRTDAPLSTDAVTDAVVSLIRPALTGGNR